MSKKHKKQKEVFYDDPPEYETPSEPNLPLRRKIKLTQLLDPAKVAQLLRASSYSIRHKTEQSITNYPTYTLEEVQQLMQEYIARKPTKPNPESK